MIDWLSDAAGIFRTKNFIKAGSGTYSFEEINKKANYIAHYLKEKYSLKQEDVAAILSENNIEFIILVFALWKSGAIPVPLNTRLNESETNHLITFLKPSFIFADTTANRDLGYKDAKSIPIAFDFSMFEKPDISDCYFDENGTALILFTSGTSGNPKGVQLSFHNLKASFENSDTVLKHNANDSWIASLPFYHIGGFSIITRALLSGTSIIIPKSPKAEDLAESIEMHRPSYISIVSTQLRRLIDLGIKPWTELKYVLLGGGHIEDSLVDEAINIGWPIAKVYGSTETSSLITFVDCIKDNNKKSSGGKPLVNNQIFTVNERKEILQPNNVGEIAIKSESCARGYYNNPFESKNKFRDGIYYTGDAGFIDEEGYLYINSRIGDLIISGGENINPVEIETALIEHPEVLHAAVFGQEDNEWGQVVLAAVIIDPGSDISEKELKEFLLRKISSFKIPRRFYFMKEFPISPLGKIQKDKLKDLVRNY